MMVLTKTLIKWHRLLQILQKSTPVSLVSNKKILIPWWNEVCTSLMKSGYMKKDHSRENPRNQTNCIQNIERKNYLKKNQRCKLKHHDWHIYSRPIQIQACKKFRRNDNYMRNVGETKFFFATNFKNGSKVHKKTSNIVRASFSSLPAAVRLRVKLPNVCSIKKASAVIA